MEGCRVFRCWGTASAGGLRATLGWRGAERKREDGTVVRSGLSERVRDKLTTPNERRLATEMLTRRVRHFTPRAILAVGA